MNYLKEVLESHSCLQYFDLNLRVCDEITDVGVNYLKEGLTSLDSLQNLSLNFRGQANKYFDELIE